MRKSETGIKWVMLVTGALTCSMLYPVFAPGAALQSMFGESLQGPVAEIVVRNWGALIAMVGGMLVFGALVPASRPLALLAAVASKLVFISLVLVHGRQFLGGQVAVAVIADLVMVVLFSSCLIDMRRDASR